MMWYSNLSKYYQQIQQILQSNAVDVVTIIVMMWLRNLDEADHFVIVCMFVHVELGSIAACEFVKNVNFWLLSNLVAKLCFRFGFVNITLHYVVIPWLYNSINTSPIVAQESKISCFHEGIGICEQLMGIPIPLSYTRLTSRFLVLWHLTLPIILWDDCHWIVIPATFISAASLFCIEEVCTSSYPDYLSK